jgi:hypothetical protein
METKCDVKINFRRYGEIIVPAGTKLTHQTASGYDEKYHFVDDLNWIKSSYPDIANLMIHDATYYGIDIPKKYVCIPKYKVYKIGRKNGMSGRKKLLGKNLTKSEAQRLVNSYPDSSRSMVLFTRQ